MLFLIWWVVQRWMVMGMAKICNNCACYEVCFMANPNRTVDCNIGWQPIIVKCKDCKWYKEGELLAPNKFCFRLKHPTENRQVGYNFGADDFCSYGERRGDGNADV